VQDVKRKQTSEPIENNPSAITVDNTPIPTPTPTPNSLFLPTPMPRDLWYRLYPNTKYLQLIRRVEGDFPEYISRIVVAPDNALWLGACGKILHFDGQVLETYTHHKLKEQCFYDIAAAPDGAIWIGDHETGLIRFDGKEWSTYTKDELVGQITDIDISSEGDV
jgi:ligand-binding sensor domain-containing protein